MELIIIPVVAALLSIFTKGNRWLNTILAAAGLGVLLLKFGPSNMDYQSGQWVSIVDVPWLSDVVHFHLGLDGISYFLLLLTNILLPLIVFSVNDHCKLSLVPLALVMQAGLNGVFMAKDGLIFYLFWELAMIPIYFITLIYAERDNFVTTVRFFIYTFIGSLGMLASLIYLYTKTPDASFAFESLMSINLGYTESIWVGAGFLLAFAVKIPLFPFHTWQPNTYTYAPAQGSMLLSGIMLKMGLYGLIRWYMPLAGKSIPFYQPILITLAVIGIVYGALIAMRQEDMKRLVAYSSLSHVGLIAAGIMTMTETGLHGALLQMFVHGVNVVGLFMAIDLIQQTYRGRHFAELGGLAKVNRWFTILFFLIIIGSAAAPLTNGFPGEFMLLKSIFDYDTTYVVFAGLTIILCAVYMLRMFQFSMLGEAQEDNKPIALINTLPLVVIAVLVIVVGIFPQWFIEIFEPAVKNILTTISNTKGVMS